MGKMPGPSSPLIAPARGRSFAPLRVPPSRRSERDNCNCQLPLLVIAVPRLSTIHVLIVETVSTDCTVIVRFVDWSESNE